MCKWKVIPTTAQWASAYADAQKKNKPSTVLAIVTVPERAASVKHAFVLEEFLEFITQIDPKRGSLGLLNM